MKRIIITEKSREQVVSRFRSLASRMKEKEGVCYLFKTTKDRTLRTALSFWFVCRILEVDDGRKRLIDYRVRPAFSSVVLLIVIPFTMLYTLVRFFSGKPVTLLYFLIALALNLVFAALYIFIKRNYIREFEETLRKE